MQIKFLGTGSAFQPHMGNSSAIVEHNGTKILIDCGYAVLKRLISMNLVTDIDYILLTHLHCDHVGSLPSLMGYTEIIKNKKIPIIYATDEHKRQIHEFMTITWEDKRAHYVPIADFPWIGFVDTFGQHVQNKQSFAYYFKNDDELIFYSGDLGNIETVTNFLDSRAESNVTAFVDINPAEKPSHIFYKNAQEQLSNFNVYGYHCDKATMPADCTLPLVEDYPELNY